MKIINIYELIQKYNIIPITLLLVVILFVLFQEDGVIENFQEGRRKKKKKHHKCKKKVKEILFMPPPFKVKENQNVALPHHFPQTDAKKLYEENKDDIKTTYTQFMLDVNKFDDVTAILMRDAMAENANIPQAS